MRRGDKRTQENEVLIVRRVRNNRKLRGFNQNDFAKMIGVTFQQLQKYELATNRISCSRLVVIAEALGVETNDFFENIEAKSSKKTFSDAEIRLVTKLRKMPAAISEKIFDLVSEV